MLGPLHASNQRHCKASTRIDTLLGKWSMRQSCAREDCVGKFGAFFVGAVAATNPPIWPQARWLGAEKAIGWIGLLQCIHSLLAIVFCNWDSVRVGGPALNFAAVGMRMQTDRESKRMRLDGWSLHEDPTANAESSGDEKGAHDGKPGKDEVVRRKEQFRFRFSASECFSTQLHGCHCGLHVDRICFPAVQAMVSKPASPCKKRVHRHGLMAYLNVSEERCQRSAMDMMQEAHHWIILPPHSRTAAFVTRACIMLHDLMAHHRS